MPIINPTADMINSTLPIMRFMSHNDLTLKWERTLLTK